MVQHIISCIGSSASSQLLSGLLLQLTVLAVCNGMTRHNSTATDRIQFPDALSKKSCRMFRATAVLGQVRCCLATHDAGVQVTERLSGSQLRVAYSLQFDAINDSVDRVPFSSETSERTRPCVLSANTQQIKLRQVPGQPVVPIALKRHIYHTRCIARPYFTGSLIRDGVAGHLAYEWRTVCAAPCSQEPLYALSCCVG